MTTWKRGRQLLRDRLQRDALDLVPFANSMDAASVTRVAGTAVFLTANPDGVPHSLLHNMKHNKVLHEHVVVLCVRILDIPRVPDKERIEHQALPNNFHRLIVRFGFKDEPDIPKALELGARQGLSLDPMETTFFIGRETLIPKVGSDMPVWREKLFIAMYRNAGSVVSYFKIPPNSVVEMGTQVIL